LVAAGLGAAGVVYAAACSVLRVPEIRAVTDTVNRLMGRNRG
jgi:hypothetical protein